MCDLRLGLWKGRSLHRGVHSLVPGRSGPISLSGQGLGAESVSETHLGSLGWSLGPEVNSTLPLYT